MRFRQTLMALRLGRRCDPGMKAAAGRNGACGGGNRFGPAGYAGRTPIVRFPGSFGIGRVIEEGSILDDAGRPCLFSSG